MVTNSVGTYHFKIDPYLTDFRGKATLSLIGNFMLQAAAKHAEERGFGYSYMKSQNRAWVLSRINIELYEYPENESILTINTWVANVNRLFTERYFSFENSEGKEIGFSKSLWAGINFETRKPTNLLELTELLKLTNKEKICPIEDTKKIPLLTSEAEIADTIIVKYSDLDINKHLNSMKYIEHLVNIFDIKLFKEKEIKTLKINYLSEGQYGTTLNILKKEENNSSFLLEMKEGDKSICSSRICWK